MIAAIIGVAFGILVEFLFSFVDGVPVLGCLISPIALLFAFALPVLIGAMAAGFGKPSGLLTTPVATMDGSLAAALAELISRLIGFLASIFAARTFFFGPRFLLPSVQSGAITIFSGVWSLGWFMASLIIAATLGALGGFLYSVYHRRQG